MKMLASLLILVATATIVTTQDTEPPVCYADEKLAADTAADVTEEGVDVSSDYLASFPAVRKCEDGPVRKLLAPPDVFYWPPIYHGSCHNLFCHDPPCIARRTIWRYKCVLVYKFNGGSWRKIGYRNIHYLDHLECSCKKCDDIRDKKLCVQTSPCPNSNNNYSFCYWKTGPGSSTQGQLPGGSSGLVDRTDCCACCNPHPCPYPKIFDYPTCSCTCPRGSKPVGNKCIGDCSGIAANHCTQVACAENKHLNCEVRGYKCLCPSCRGITDRTTCKKTKCLEQPLQPRCVFDEYYRCRCPSCTDQTERWCEVTNCGPYNQHICKYDSYMKKCTCPYQP